MYSNCRIVSISTAIVHICGGGDSVVYLQVDKAPYSGQVKTKWRRAGLRYADGSGASVHVCTIDTPQSSLSLCSVIPSLSCLCRQPLRIHIHTTSCLETETVRLGVSCWQIFTYERNWSSKPLFICPFRFEMGECKWG